MNNAKILIAEDDKQFSSAMQYYLRKLMIETILVEDGERALEIIRKSKPNIILLDLNMPKMDGIELLNELEKIDNLSINIIVISGDGKFINNIPIKSYKLIKGIFYKPVNLQKIYNSIKHILLDKENKNNIIEIKKIIDIFEFNKASKGYRYLIDCIVEIVNNPNGLKNIERIVYKNVADKNDVDNINQIKWCILKSIKSMVRYTDNDILNSYFVSGSNISPKHFINTIYNIINSKKVI